MAKPPVWDVILQKKNWLWGTVIPAVAEPGDILAVKHPFLTEQTSLYFASDLPGNHWFSIGDSRLPLLADKVLNWKGQALALAAAPDRTSLREMGQWIQPVVQPFPSAPWQESREVLHAKTLVQNPVAATPTGTICKRWRLGSGTKTETHPCEIWALFKGGELFLQAPGAWPSCLRDGAPRVLGLPADKIFFQVSSVRVPSVAFNAFLLPASLYAGILAVKTGQPIRFLLDGGWKTAWPSLAPEIIADAHADYNPEGSLTSLEVTTKVHAGRTGVFIREWANRFLQTIRAYYPSVHLKLDIRVLASYEAPRTPVFGWGEMAAGLFLQDLSAEIERRLRRVDFDPVPLRHPKFNDLFQILTHLTHWPRHWSARTTHPVTTLVPKKGLGLGYGFSFSGFLSAETAPFSIRLCLEKDKTVRIVCPMPLSDAIWGRLRQIFQKAELPWHPSVETWYGLDCPETGPAILGRPFEILPKLVARSLHQLAKRKPSKTGSIVQTAVYHRPSSRAYNSETMEGNPFISVGLVVCQADVVHDPLFESFTLQNLTVVLDMGDVDQPLEVEHSIRQSANLIVRWLWGRVQDRPFSLRIETMRRPGKNPGKSIHNAMWSALPHALIQACRMARPGWCPDFFSEVVLET